MQALNAFFVQHPQVPFLLCPCFLEPLTSRPPSEAFSRQGDAWRRCLPPVTALIPACVWISWSCCRAKSYPELIINISPCLRLKKIKPGVARFSVPHLPLHISENHDVLEVGITIKHVGPPKAAFWCGGQCNPCVWKWVIPHTFHFISAAMLPVEVLLPARQSKQVLVPPWFPLVTTPDISSFFWAASLWVSVISLAAKALAEHSVSPVVSLQAFAISGCYYRYYLSCQAAVSSHFESRHGNEWYLWDGHAMLLAREMSSLFGMNAPPLLHCRSCHVCREFGKASCIYIGIYLSQIWRLFSIACVENAAIESQAFFVTLSPVTIFNADASA